MPSFAEMKRETPEIEELEEKINVMELADAEVAALEQVNKAIDALNVRIAAKPRTAHVSCINNGCNTRIITAYAPGKQMACIECRCANWPAGSAGRCRLIRRLNVVTGKPEQFCTACSKDPATKYQIDSEDESDEEFEERDASSEDEDSADEDEDMEFDDAVHTRGRTLVEDVRGTEFEKLPGKGQPKML